MQRRCDELVLASAQATAGVLTAAQLRALGATEALIRRRVATGAWVRAHKAVYIVDAALAAAIPTRAQAALLAGPPGSAISHVLAGHLYGWQGLPTLTVPELTTLPSAGRHRRPGLVVHRAAVVEPTTLASHPNLVVTTAVRTVADLASTLSRWRLLAVCDSAIRRRQVSRAVLLERAGEWSGRSGVGRLREVAALADGHAESAFESRFRLVLRDAGLPRPTLQFRVVIDGREYRLDFAFPSVLVAIEADGRGVHGLPEALLEDRRRQNALQNAGWLVLRFTWDDLVHHPERVIAEVVRALRERGLLAIEV